MIATAPTRLDTERDPVRSGYVNIYAVGMVWIAACWNHQLILSSQALAKLMLEWANPRSATMFFCWLDGLPSRERTT